jgi:hypothetical protein
MSLLKRPRNLNNYVNIQRRFEDKEKASIQKNGGQILDLQLIQKIRLLNLNQSKWKGWKEKEGMEIDHQNMSTIGQ